MGVISWVLGFSNFGPEQKPRFAENEKICFPLVAQMFILLSNYEG